MAGETPRGGAVQTGGGEGIEAQLSGAGVDVIGNGLQGLEVGDLVQRVTGLLQQSLVDDDAKGLVAVTDGNGLAVGILQIKVMGGHLVVHVGAFQVVAELTVAVDSTQIAHLEHGGSGVLIHLGGQGGVVLAGGGGDNLDGYTGLSGVGGGQSLPSGVGLGLEVQVVHAAGGSVAALVGVGIGLLLLAAGYQGQSHHESQEHCKKLLHLRLLLQNNLFSRRFRRKNLIQRLCTEPPSRSWVGSTSQQWAP